MEVLVFENGSHIKADALRKAFPDLTIHGTADITEALRMGANAEVLAALAHHVTDPLLEAMPKLRWIAALTTGTDHFHSLTKLRKDVLVTNARGIHGPQMSELAIMNMIALSRRLPAMLRNQANAKWERWPQPVLQEKTVVIVGVGQIGEALADRCRSFGMKIVGVSDARPDIPGFDQVLPRTKLKEAAALADFLVTLVPLTGDRSSLVCVVGPTEAERLQTLDEAELNAEIERRSHSILGKVTVEPGRGVFPLAVETVRSFGRHRIALVGEAAHLVPPIGAQGLNLGLRDAATVGELVVEARRDGGDIGADTVLERYDALRRADVQSRTLAVDLLNRTLLSDFLPAQSARGLGLYLLDRIGPLRRAAMREGVAPRMSQPRLMRGEAL